MRAAIVLAGILFSSTAAADEERACIPGKQIACACAAGASGFQRCKENGSVF